MAESDFFQYLADSLRTMLTTRADELIRITFSNEVYSTSKTKLRPQAEIDAIANGMQGPINQLVERYLSEMKANGLTSPGRVKANGQKLREITCRMEKEFEELLKSRLGCNDQQF